jgi:hypothetical protein
MSFKTQAGFQTEGSYTPDNLHAGDFPIRTRKVTLVTGQNLVRGALLGAITASGKYKLSASADADGSQAPTAILAEDVDATAGDKDAVVYLAGDFNANALTYGAGHTAASVREGLRDLGIYLHTPVSA